MVLLCRNAHEMLLLKDNTKTPPSPPILIPLWEMALIVRSIFLWESERKWKAINTNNMLYVHKSNTHTHTPILEWICYIDSYIYTCNSIFTWWHKGILSHCLVIWSIINDLILEYNIVFLLLLMVHIEHTLICLVLTRTW